MHQYPTPTVSGNNNRRGAGPKSGDGLATAVKMLPTTCAQDNSTLPVSQSDRVSIPGYLLRSGEKPGGQLNPDWVEWLMGWPVGWTSLEPMERLVWPDWSCDPGATGEIPRTGTKISCRAQRLKGIGNGQVPQALVLAWGELEKRLFAGGAA